MGVREAALLALEEMERAEAYSGIAVKRSIGRSGVGIGGGYDGGVDGSVDSGDEIDDGYGGAVPANSVGARDRALLRELVLGVTRWKLALDDVIFKHSKIKKHRVSPVILTILRLGVYQLNYLDKIPASAACNESVKLAKKYGNEGSARYVNALLRSVAAEKLTDADGKQSAHAPADVSASAALLSVRYSYPLWLCEKWLNLYGYDFATAQMDAGNRRPELSIRVNTLRISPSELAERLMGRGFSTEPGKYSPNALIIKNPGDFTQSPEFLEGLFTVQDEASMLAAEALGAQRGDRIMDACAAPGGKCGYVAELTGGCADILAADIRPHRVALMEQNFKRLGHSSINCRVMDALLLCEDIEGTMDRVLVDAPCSGFGVVRRKPEIKWTRGPMDIESAAALQTALLLNAARYVKKGGTLVYSVCTTEPEECENIVGRFLCAKDHYVYEPEDLRQRLPPGLWGKCGGAGNAGIYIYPHIHGIDGFYIARLKRL